MDTDGTLQPGTAGLVHLRSGEALRITDVEGRQVADMVAFSADDPDTEWLSPTHTRSALGRLRLRCGDTLLTNLRRPILQLVQDDVGVHDMSFAMCDRERYAQDFGIPDHPSCRDGMTAALVPLGVPAHRVPDPVNVFQNSAVTGDGVIETREPESRAGDSVVFRAVRDAWVAVSACPQDQNPCNGWAPSPVRLGKERA